MLLKWLRPLTFEGYNFTGGVHDGRIGRDWPSDRILDIVEIQNNHLGRIPHLLPDAYKFVGFHSEGAEPDVCGIDPHILELKLYEQANRLSINNVFVYIQVHCYDIECLPPL